MRAGNSELIKVQARTTEDIDALKEKLVVTRRIIADSLTITERVRTGMNDTPVAETLRGDIERLHSNLFHLLKGLTGSTATAGDSANTASPALNGLNILLAEDDKMVSLIAERILTRNGATISVATNGREAVIAASQTKYDLILMDVQMPEMNGIDATKTIRKHDNSTPIIALTATNIQNVTDEYGKIGFTDTMAKPYNEITLISKILAHSQNPSCADGAQLTNKLYNLEKLTAIGDHQFILRMLRLFVREIPTAVATIKKAYQSSDFASVRYTMHRIRPSIINLGITTVQHEVTAIEQLAGENTASITLEEMISKLAEVMNNVTQQLTRQYPEIAID